MIKYNFPMDLGKAIAELRKRNGRSQEQLAFDAGVSRHYMYKIENNLASPTVKSLEKLAAALKIKPSIIFLTAEQIN